MSETTRTTPTLAYLRERREEILRLAAQHGASNVRVFGSVARGEATPESDIDLLVSWDYAHISSWGGVGLALDLQEILHCAVDVVSEKWLHPLLRDQILAEAIRL